MAKLEFAFLMYGSNPLKVTPSEHLPIPETFDFANPVECAKKVLAILSNASGGHRLAHCKLFYSEKHGYANITSSGAHAYFTNGVKANSIEEACKMHAEGNVVNLGDVVTDQYGEGWKRAVWS